MQMHIVLLVVVLFSVYQGATSRTTTRAIPTRAPTPTPRAHPTQPPTKKPTTKAPTKDTTISLPNQITGDDKKKYFHTQKELNVEIKKTTSGPVPSGKVIFYKDGAKLGSKTLSGGKAKYTISTTPKDFQGAHAIKIAYSGDKIYKQKSETFELFFFTIPKNGNYLINGNQSTTGNMVTFFNATRQGWNTKNKLPTNIDFFGWAKPTPIYTCSTKFNVRISTAQRQVYDFTGVIAVKTIGTSGVASSTKIQKVVVVDTRGKPDGTGKVLASFCASAV